MPEESMEWLSLIGCVERELKDAFDAGTWEPVDGLFSEEYADFFKKAVKILECYDRNENILHALAYLLYVFDSIEHILKLAGKGWIGYVDIAGATKVLQAKMGKCRHSCKKKGGCVAIVLKNSLRGIEKDTRDIMSLYAELWGTLVGIRDAL